MGISINGRNIAMEEKMEISKFVEELKEKGLRVPTLSTIIVGNDGGSLYYIKSQEKLCKSLGVENKNFYLDENTSEEELLKLINSLNEDSTVDGIIVMMPLPKHLNERKIINAIDATKDVDGLTIQNIGKFYSGEECFVPCTPQSVLNLIKWTGVNIEGKKVVVIGRSNVVGKPVFQLLLNENATVTICHSKTKNLLEECKSADILISAIGKPKYINSNYVKENAIIIDVGTSSVNGVMMGDVDFEDVINKVSYITPVPGGVGAMTTTLLIKNVCEARKKNVY